MYKGTETLTTTMQEYVRVLDALGEIRRLRPITWPPVQPVPQSGKAVEIGTGTAAILLRNEESRLVGRLEQLEDIYHGLGGDRRDLHQLAIRHTDGCGTA
jgi:hypothetical protein